MMFIKATQKKNFLPNSPNRSVKLMNFCLLVKIINSMVLGWSYHVKLYVTAQLKWGSSRQLCCLQWNMCHLFNTSGWVIINKNHTNLGLCCLFLWLSCQLLLKDCKASYSPAEWSVHRVCNRASQVSLTTSWICFSTGVNSNSLPHLWKANCLANDSTNYFDFWFSLIQVIRAL